MHLFVGNGGGMDKMVETKKAKLKGYGNQFNCSNGMKVKSY